MQGGEAPCMITESRVLQGSGQWGGVRRLKPRFPLWPTFWQIPWPPLRPVPVCEMGIRSSSLWLIMTRSLTKHRHPKKSQPPGHRLTVQLEPVVHSSCDRGETKPWRQVWVQEVRILATFSKNFSEMIYVWGMIFEFPLSREKIQLNSFHFLPLRILKTKLPKHLQLQHPWHRAFSKKKTAVQLLASGWPRVHHLWR